MYPRPTVTTSQLPAGRGCVHDIATLALAIPLFPVERSMQLEKLVAARAESRAKSRVESRRRIGWAAIFIKAYALVAREMPELRSWLSGRLRHRLATSSHSTATLAVHRGDLGTDRLFLPRIIRPEEMTLREIQGLIHQYTTRAPKDVFARQLELEMLPGILRRAVLRWNMRSASPRRTARIGTFSVSTLAGFEATNRMHPTICTTSLSYGPVESDGRCLVTLIADHRVLDGATVARALARLEAVLTSVIVEELSTEELSTEELSTEELSTTSCRATRSPRETGTERFPRSRPYEGRDGAGRDGAGVMRVSHGRTP
ncbi:MAG: 2-oxo acid dehydrogenase subunit E2 [bacterium]